jgi:hypothetical protein
MIAALQPLNLELSKTLDDLAPHQDRYGIEHNIRLPTSTHLNSNSGSPGTQRRDRYRPLALKMYDKRVREHERNFAGLPSQLNFPSTAIEGQFELPDT